MSETIEMLMTTEEVAKLLRVTSKHVRNLPIRFVQVGKRKRRYDGSDVRAYIATQKNGESGCPSTSARARRTTTRNSRSTIVGFAEALKLQPAEKH